MPLRFFRLFAVLTVTGLVFPACRNQPLNLGSPTSGFNFPGTNTNTNTTPGTTSGWVNTDSGGIDFSPTVTTNTDTVPSGVPFTVPTGPAFPWLGNVVAFPAPAQYTSPLWSAFFSDQNAWSSQPYYYETLRYPDVNGDGRADICGRGVNGIFCALSTGVGFAPATAWSAAYSDAGGWASQPYYWKTIQYADLNGDGKDDICGRASGGMYCALSTGDQFGAPSYWTAAYSNAGGWAALESYWATIQLVDVTGDGLADVCGRASGGMYCAVSTGSAFQTPYYWTASFSNAHGWSAHAYYWDTIRYPDLNGDGRADVCGRAAAGMYCALSSGGTFNNATYWTTGYGNDTGWIALDSYWKTIQFPDVNADGLADVCGRGHAGLHCSLSNGTAFVDMRAWTTQIYGNEMQWHTQESYWSTIQYPDLNGDGAADVCGRSQFGLVCGISGGKDFGNFFLTGAFSDAQGWSSHPSGWKSIRFPDLDNDGHDDVCARSASGILCGLTP